MSIFDRLLNTVANTRRAALFRVAQTLMLCAVFAPALSPAAQYPDKPVRIIVPLAAGAGIDTFVRALAQRLSKQWNQPVIVDNRPGAGATLGTAAAAKAPADGYTLLLGANPLGISPVVYPNLPYDARRDFVPITLLATTPEALAVSRASGITSVAELTARAKLPGKLNYGSAGNGTLSHLAGLMFSRSAKMDVVHIPFKGSTPELAALLAGQIDWMFDSPAALVPHAKSGSLRLLAVAAPKRTAQVPEVPTLTELGFSDMEFLIWIGLFAPAGTPDAIVKQIEASTTEALRDPSLRTSVTGQGWDIAASSASEFASFFEAEMKKLGEASRAANLKAE